MSQVTGTAETGYNGGISPAMPPAEALWPGFTNVAGGKSLVKFVVGYCGMVAIHTHANAAEWNTVINGEGTVSYVPVNGGSLVTMYVKTGDTFVFPQGSAHWWVNYSPTEQLATVGGFTAPFPDAAPLADFLDESKKVNNLLTDAVLGQNYRSAIELQEMNGADTLFPLLSTRYPSTCGGNTPCQKCN
jgi:mannose-6-phosphate isomerase-like protein (cupin superfamily)